MTEKGQAFTISDSHWKLNFDAKQVPNEEDEANQSEHGVYDYAKI